MTEDLNEFFSSIGKAKKEKEDELKSIIGDVSVDSIFSEASKEVVKDKKKKKENEIEKKKKLQKEKRQTKALEEWLYSETKVEEKKDDYKELEKEISSKKKPSKPAVKEIKEEDDSVDKALKALEKVKTKEEVRENINDPEIVKIRSELEYLKNLVNAQGGGGEVRFEFLDDVNRNSVKTDGYLIAYDSTTGKFIGTTTSPDAEPTSWVVGSAGIHTTKNVGIGTTARADTTLYIQGDIFTTGNISAAGTVTYNDVENIDSLGIITGRSDLYIGGNARVVGVITATTFSGALSGNADTATSATSATSATTAGYATTSGISTTSQGLTGTPNISVTGIAATSAVFTGVVTAASYVGDGSALTGVGGGKFASNATGINTSSNIGIGTTTASSALTVSGDAYISGNARVVGVMTVGSASVTIDGDNNEVSVGIVTVTSTQIIVGDSVSIDSSASGINSAPNVLYVAKDGIDTNNGTSIDNAKLTIAAAVGIAQSGTTIKVLSGNYVEQNPIEVPAFVAIVGDDQRTVKVLPNTSTKDLFHVRKGCKLANMTFSGHLSPAAAVGFPTTEIAENVGGGKWKGPYVQNCTSDTTTGTGIRIDGDQARSLKAMNVDAFTQYNQGGVGVAVTNGGFAQLVSLFTICCDEAVTCDKGGQADIANSNCSFGTFGLVARGTGDLQFSGVVTSTAAASQDNISINISTPTINISDFDYTHTTGIATITTSSDHGFVVGMGVTLSSNLLNCTYGNKTYPRKNPYIFEVDEIPTSRKFVVNVGISTLAHTYVSGGTAKVDIDRPYDGQAVYFDTLFKSVETITVSNGGSGYTSTPTITVADPAGSNGETATAFATLDGDSISTITMISSGNQYTSTPSVTISGGGGSGASATANMSPIYYTINSSSPVVSGITTLTLDENLINSVGIGSTAYFYQLSRIVASSHTFEYVGSGNNITSATPKRGGVTVQANEVVTQNGGKVVYTSTDQSGNFRIGDGLQINQNTGTISGRSFTKSLFSEMTPFILALS